MKPMRPLAAMLKKLIKRVFFAFVIFFIFVNLLRFVPLEQMINTVLEKTLLEQFFFKGPVSNFWGSLNRVTVVAKNTAYAGWGTRLAVIDVSNPQKPELVKKIPLHGIVHGSLIHKNILYVAAGSPGLFIYDISQPHEPRLLSRHYSGGYGMAVALKNNILFFCDEQNGLIVLDVKDPKRPKKLRHIKKGYANAITLRGNTAFLSDGKRGLVIFDVSKPEKPKEISALDLTYKKTPPPLDPPPLWVDVKDHFAYVAMGVEGIFVVDVKNLKKPRVVNKIPLNGFTYTVVVKENIAFVADIVKGLLVFDVRTAGKPRLIASHKTPGNAFDVFLYGKQKAVISDGANGLVVFDVSFPSRPRLLGSISPPPIFRSVKFYKGFLYAPAGGGGVYVYDITKPKPKLARHIDTIGFASRITFIKDKAYVADVLGGALVLDVKNPAKPKPIKIFDIEEHPWGVDHADDILAIANAHHGLVLFDVNDWKNPAYLSRLDTGRYSIDIAVEENLALVADLMGGIFLFDISDPAHPKRAGSYPENQMQFGLRSYKGRCMNVKIYGHTAYLAAYNKGLLILDISNPPKPNLLGQLKTGGYAYGVEVKNNTAYIADFEKGLVVADISNPERPRKIARYKTPGNPHGVTVYENRAYIADGEAGLTVVDLKTGNVIP